MFAILLSE